MMLLSFCAVAVACALLSIVVVARRWAFIGEGIGHSGFGGAGTAWMLMALVPALDLPWLPYLFVVLFALGAALGMGLLSRRGQISGDVAVGIFLVATVAWGFIGQEIYRSTRNAEPAGFFTLFFGKPTDVSAQYAVASVMIVSAVILALTLLRREIIAYCVDPMLAETSGVRVGLVHYLLIALTAVTTIVGLHIVGTLLITALLVLPGATGMLLSKRLSVVTMIAVLTGLAGAVGGFVVGQKFQPRPVVGPAFVLTMFAIFGLAFVISRIRRSS
jgi:ABC-type Mn2+/Zn2+ transport system permease subunit